MVRGEKRGMRAFLLNQSCILPHSWVEMDSAKLHS